MKNTKKILSVVLAVVMALTAFSIVSFAAITVTSNSSEVDGAINVKLEVVQVTETPEDSESGEVYTADNNDIYAVTLYAKVAAPYGIKTFRTCVKYDNSKFEPIMSYDGVDLLVGEDFYNNTMEFGTRIISYGPQFDDKNFYDADGNIVSGASAAVVSGLGKTKTAVQKKFECAIDGESTYYSDSYGVMLCEMVGKQANKGAFLNTVNGRLINNDYVELFTIYFQRQVAESAVYGQSLGFMVDEVKSFDNDDVVCSSGNPGYTKGEAVTSIPMNFVSNAVEAPVKPLASLTAGYGAKSQQIAFNSATSVDYRFVAQFSTTAFPITYDESTEKITATDIDEVGFVMTKVGEGDAATIAAMSAADVAALSKTEGTYRKVWTTKISTDMAGGAAFAFSCRIAGITVTGGVVSAEYIAVPYVISSGAITFGQAMQSGVQARYDAYHVQAGF